MESAVWEASLFEEHGFRDFKISVKHNDPVVMVEAYRQLAERGDWPLHLGVTEAGPAFQGTIKSSVAFGTLLSQGIGDTIRVSLSAPPVEEVKVTSRSVILSRGRSSSGWTSDEAGAALGATARSTISSISLSERAGLFVSLTCVPSGRGLRARRHPS